MRSKALPGWAHTLCTAAAALVFLLAYELVVYRVPVTEIFLPVSSWSDEVIYIKARSRPHCMWKTRRPPEAYPKTP